MTAKLDAPRSSKPVIRYSARQVAELVGGHPPTEEQAAIIAAPLEPAVIIAGAGSGKTETIATRVVWLVANQLVAPDRILGLTFTRKAASELSQRITSRLRRFMHSTDQRVGDIGFTTESGAEPTVCTYAAFASTVVADHGLRLGSEPGAQLLTGAARWQLAWDVVTRFDGELHADIGAPRSVTRYVLALADEMANHLIRPEKVHDFSAEVMAAVLAVDTAAGFAQPVKQFLQRSVDRLALLDLVRRFEERKAERHVRDFGDQMRLATQLSALPAVQAAERLKYDVVLLDEYQDTSHSETVLLESLFGDGRPVTAVGDPLQAIYGWRGASASNITAFAHRFADSAGQPAAQFSLMTSWRNDRAILTGANAVAAAARAQTSKTVELTPRPAAGRGTVAVSFAESTMAEAEWIAEQLQTEWLGRADWTDGLRTAAVLVRNRSHIPAIVAALQAKGLPLEVLSLGGLLSLPEINDVLATLKVLTHVRAAAALTRLLTGARWRLGLADLVALSERAGQIARAEQPRDASGVPIGRPEPHLVDALDSLGPAARYSEQGHSRLNAFAAELAALRRRCDQPLPDLLEDIVRVTGLGAELAVRGGAARANLDRLVDEAARFTAESAGSIPSFLAYLQAARAEDRGLDTAETQVQAERIQVLTVHGAKGLEWDVVAVAGLADGSFPAEPRGESWTNQRGKVPFELRGDADALPVLELTHAQKPSEVNKALTAFISRVNEHRLREERRLAYVAMTRPRKALYCSGSAWSPGTKTIKKPSAYLVELGELDVVEVSQWHVPAADEVNPLTAEISSLRWPVDNSQRVAATLAAAELVRCAVAASSVSASSVAASSVAASSVSAESVSAESAPVGSVSVESEGAIEVAALAPSRWHAEVDMLLAERLLRSRSEVIDVPMPRQLSTSAAVMLAQDPAAFARGLRRPMPRQPSAAAAQGSAFHQWIEHRFAAAALLDIDDLFDGDQQTVDGQQLESLRQAFLASEWAERTPIAVEVGFELPVGPTIVRGRMDAVFAAKDGSFTVVDWKTGAVPSGRDAAAKSVQLAAYRLAWARMNEIADADIHTVRAAFHYVGANTTVYPADLLDATGLRKLLTAPRRAAPAVAGGQ